MRKTIYSLKINKFVNDCHIKCLEAAIKLQIKSNNEIQKILKVSMNKINIRYVSKVSLTSPTFTLFWEK